MGSRPLEGVRAFLSGPMTGCECYNLIEFTKAHERLQRLGAAYIYNPAFDWLHGMQRGETEASHDYYMRKTIGELARQDMALDERGKARSFYNLVVLLDGWEASLGARTELCVAQACGINVVELGNLDGWIERGMQDEQDHGCVGAPEGARQHHEHGGDRGLRRD